MLILRNALSVSLFADHETGELIKISPFVPVVPEELKTLTLPPVKFVESVVGVIFPPASAIVKSTGSKIHVPALPFGALVETWVVSAMF